MKEQIVDLKKTSTAFKKTIDQERATIEDLAEKLDLINKAKDIALAEKRVRFLSLEYFLILVC
jgi:hypothetical protein